MAKNIFIGTTGLAIIGFIILSCHRTDQFELANDDLEDNTDSQSDIDSNPDSDADSDSTPETTTEIESDAETDTKTDIETDTQTDIDTDTQTDIATDSTSDPTPGECRTEKDCQLVNDCCSCLAIGTDQKSPSCELEECFVLTCEAYPFRSEKKVACVAGRCVLNVSCDDRQVPCKRLEPECPKGQEAMVDKSGMCWTEKCLDVTQCSGVSSCDDCSTGQACVAYMDEGGTTYHCVMNEEECRNDVSCQCLGQSVCILPYYECFESAENLSCECTNC